MADLLPGDHGYLNFNNKQPKLKRRKVKSVDKLTLNFQLEQESPNEVFRAFDDGEGLKLRINDGTNETTFPIGLYDAERLNRFLNYYINQKENDIQETENS